MYNLLLLIISRFFILSRLIFFDNISTVKHQDNLESLVYNGTFKIKF